MKTPLIALATVAVVTTAIFATTPASAHGCTAANIRLGILNLPECNLDPEDLIRAYERYKARQEGLVATDLYLVPQPEVKPQPDLSIFDLDADTWGFGTIVVTYHVQNTGDGDAGAFDTSSIIHFDRVDGSGTTMATPEVVPVYSLSAGDSIGLSTDLVGSVSVPDTRFTYDVIVHVTADSGGDIAESDETNNTQPYACRYIGTDSDQYLPPPQGLGVCH